ncbi:hypothetical protein [Halorussus lipolyticus]|uniref:hypothetical protein n=1 Tax=Halorussus lipolyticus TaxID=3034024 RepID=UPI0023E82319|nr:hypothetical protein [Halorussus sp. DT80]
MTSKKRLLAVALAGLLVLSSVSAASAVSSAGNTAANDSLTVTVENAGNDGATVSVTQNDTAVANASVTVEANTTYAGVGEYTTGDAGGVSLPEPAENVTVDVTAAKGNVTGSTTATIYAAEDGDTSDDGDDKKTFGDLVSSFVEEMMNAGDDGGPIGQVISEFVTENNPGNASEKRPDHAGKPDDAGKNGKDKGKPDHAGGQNKTDDDGDSQGPPENAGKDKGDDSDDSDSSDDDSDSNSNGNGNGKNKGNGKGKGR